MITKQHLNDSLVHELDVCEHLFTKLTPEAYDYRPSDGQRSTAELLRYLSFVGIGTLKVMRSGDWDAYRERAALAAEMPVEDFPQALRRQRQEIAEYFDAVTDDELATLHVKVPGYPTELPLAAAIVSGTVKWLAAYKLQLFLYAKATSAPDIVTPNAWGGVDRKA